MPSMDSDELLKTRVVLSEDVKFHNPVVVCGFVDSFPVGSLTATYMVDQLKLHQIGHLRSYFIPPIAVFVGQRLRNPFRIYINSGGTLVVILSESPIGSAGYYEISSVLVNWIESINASDLVIIEGTQVEGVQDERDVYGIAGKEKLQEYQKKGLKAAKSALIGGLGGAIMNQCIERDLASLCIMADVSAYVPDPDSALRVITALNNLFGLKIPTEPLEESIKEIHKQIRELATEMDKMKKDETPGSDGLYG